jgi:hypothetical protein
MPLVRIVLDPGTTSPQVGKLHSQLQTLGTHAWRCRAKFEKLRLLRRTNQKGVDKARR